VGAVEGPGEDGADGWVGLEDVGGLGFGGGSVPSISADGGAALGCGYFGAEGLLAGGYGGVVAEEADGGGGLRAHGGSGGWGGGEGSVEGLGEVAGGLGGGDPAGVVVGDHFGHAAVWGGQDGEAAGHGFDAGEGEVLPAGRDDGDGGLREGVEELGAGAGAVEAEARAQGAGDAGAEGGEDGTAGSAAEGGVGAEEVEGDGGVGTGDGDGGVDPLDDPFAELEAADVGDGVGGPGFGGAGEDGGFEAHGVGDDFDGGGREGAALLDLGGEVAAGAEETVGVADGEGFHADDGGEVGEGLVPVVVLEDHLGWGVEVDDAGWAEALSQAGEAAGEEVVEGGLPLLGFDDVDGGGEEEALDVAGGLPGEEVGGAVGEGEEAEDAGLLGGFGGVVGDGFFEGEAVDGEVGFGVEGIGGQFGALGDDVDGVAGFGEKVRHVAGVGADAAGRVGRGWVFTAQDEMVHHGVDYRIGGEGILLGVCSGFFWVVRERDASDG
jgi:hypothetical protein